MKKPNIIVTKSDYAQLSRMLEVDARYLQDGPAMEALEAELKRAKVVSAEDVPPDVITMNSRSELLDVETGERMEFTVVFPGDANVDEGKISVLAPVGAGMLGYRVGDIFESPTPFNLRRLKVLEVSFQPEAMLLAAG